jgi:hypothetical protein
MASHGQNFFVAAGDAGDWALPESYPVYPADDANVVTDGGTSLTTTSASGA